MPATLRALVPLALTLSMVHATACDNVPARFGPPGDPPDEDVGATGNAQGVGGTTGGTTGSTEAPAPPAIEAGTLPAAWIRGAANCNQNADPPLQVHAYNGNLTILRQNKCLNFEGPFIYLLFGTQKALLLDTGATASAATFPLRQTVEGLLTAHYGAAQRPQIQLIVAHSHAHGDHRAADGQFAGQAATTVVGTSQAAVAAFFGVQTWPDQVVSYDLGDRVLQVIPIPGHEASHIALYDARTGLLLTGDSLYPGRLYVQQWEPYRASIARLVRAVEGKPVTAVLGTHIEMSKTPGVDYPTGSTFQPDEHALPLAKDVLLRLDAELKRIGVTPARSVQDDFIITPL
ncbi:MAG TPA: MBL fold metallo-hydrolase [Myxococcota bacterium]|nr:MBL fold metallo-hydrolase [Myxococcota bacterium]